jgi:hypothetical protein
MLQFNLSKPDRVVLHKRIASLHITPKEISLMSSTDLANEETKQSIKIAEKEALEHSILQKTKVPRAKITHKGLQDIEDVNGEAQGLRDEREQEEEERRERERMARLRAAQTQQQQQQQHQSTPQPESPTTHQSTWGAPPPNPIAPTFPRPSSDFIPAEPELNLADFINMDEEPPVHDGPPKEASPMPVGVGEAPPLVQESPGAATGAPSSTGISPFAAKTDTIRSSFDLNSLWTAPKPDPASPAPSPSTAVLPATLTPSTPPPPPPPLPSAIGDEKHAFIDAEILGEATDDQDFDMFLEEKDQDGDAAGENNSPEALQAAFDGLPHVWTGMVCTPPTCHPTTNPTPQINMPLDSTIPQETLVCARQLGGRHLPPTSPLWRTLFPAELLRIDGRVPVDKSAQFLLQMRMNPTKELLSVAFAPGAPGSAVGFGILMDFLIAKG